MVSYISRKLIESSEISSLKSSLIISFSLLLFIESNPFLLSINRCFFTPFWLILYYTIFFERLYSPSFKNPYWIIVIFSLTAGFIILILIFSNIMSHARRTLIILISIPPLKYFLFFFNNTDLFIV